jgi:opacity protein-like surface antigen
VIGISRKNKTLLLIIILYFCSAGSLTASDYTPQWGGLGVQMSIWKPTSLDNRPSEPFHLINGSKIAKSLFFFSPMWQGISLRLQTMQWQMEVESSLDKVHLGFLTLDIKQQIVTQARISPFLIGGASLIWGKEKSPGHNPAFDHLGNGLQVGAGVDFFLSNKIGLALEYQYVYAKLSQPLGPTDNYTGPNLGAKLFFTF